MINRESVEKYFCLMKSKQVITDYWSFDSYIEREDYIKIFFLHKSGKRSSYVFSKELVLQELRDDCLRNLLVRSEDTRVFYNLISQIVGFIPLMT